MTARSFTSRPTVTAQTPQRRVFEHEDDAYDWRREIAANGWAELYGNEPEPDDVAAEYFDRQEIYREFFDVTQCEIEPSVPLAPEHEPVPARVPRGDLLTSPSK